MVMMTGEADEDDDDKGNTVPADVVTGLSMS